MNSSDLLVSLAEVGKLFYERMLARLDAGNYPPDNSDRGFSSIQRATSVKSPVHEGNRYQIDIAISVINAPYARAYEWGSGEHGPKGATYPIDPVNADMMVFPWDPDWPKWEDWEGAGAVPIRGIFFLTHVEHPGVEAKPYIHPTIVEIHEQVRKKLAHDFKVSWLKGGKHVEVVIP